MFALNGQRILVPDEIYKLYRQISHIDAYIKFIYIFSTGFRISEYNYVFDYPDMIDYDKRIIYFKDNEWDNIMRFRDRKIYLSSTDMNNVILFIKLNERMNIKSYQLNRNLKLWAAKAGMDPTGIDSKALRRTRMAWLLALFPQFENRIISSIDFHQDVEPYRTVPFTLQDKLGMICMLGDWSGTNIPSNPENKPDTALYTT